MEIRINTEKDSADHIKKIIKFLQSIVGEENNSDNGNFVDMFSDGESTANSNTEGDGMFSIFSDDDIPSTTIEEASSSKTGVIEGAETNVKSKDFDNSNDEPQIKIIPY